jgi:drug/metabolite transporter (DMT)-like permease
MECWLKNKMKLDQNIGFIKNNFNRNRLGPYDLMAGSSLYCAFFCLLTSFFTGEIFTFYGYVKKYPLFSFDFLMLSLCGTFGQVFIFYTVNVFGPLVLSIVTTTRKFMSIVITIIYFNHPIGI